MTLLESLKLPMGTPIIDFSLPATNGKIYSPSDFSDKKILVIIFMCNHCPYVHAVIDRLIAIQSDYADKDIQLIAINANDSVNYPEDSFESMKDFVVERSINFVYLHDEDQSIAKAYKAQCTPDIYVFDSTRQLVYHGRIDDNWQDESSVTKQELREALDAILEERPIAENQQPTIGCSIKWK
jgi:peroxiredoxin